MYTLPEFTNQTHFISTNFDKNQSLIHYVPFRLIQVYLVFWTLKLNINYFCVWERHENLQVGTSKLR